MFRSNRPSGGNNMATDEANMDTVNYYGTIKRERCLYDNSRTNFSDCLSQMKTTKIVGKDTISIPVAKGYKLERDKTGPFAANVTGSQQIYANQMKNTLEKTAVTWNKSEKLYSLEENPGGMVQRPEMKVFQSINKIQNIPKPPNKLKTVKTQPAKKPKKKQPVKAKKKSLNKSSLYSTENEHFSLSVAQALDNMSEEMASQARIQISELLHVIKFGRIILK